MTKFTSLILFASILATASFYEQRTTNFGLAFEKAAEANSLDKSVSGSKLVSNSSGGPW
jgi:hypothetical protein